jgi:adenylate cyclase
MLSVLAGLLTLPASTTDTATRIEYAQFDNMFALRGERTPRSDVVIVSIDEPSYSALSVPLTDTWPRQMHTKLLSRLADDGAKRVVFDILFVDSSAEQKIDDDFAAAMSRVPTVLGAATGFSHQATINGSYMLEEMLKPAPVFASKAAGVGIVGLPVEFGRVRTVMPPRSEMFPEVPSLAQAASGVDDTGKLPGARALMNFYGASHTIPTISYYMAVADDKPLPKGMFTDKIVFVGLNLRSRTGPSQREAFVTPFDQGTFGTEIQATAASNILSQDWISRLSPRVEIIVAGVVATLFALLLMSSSGVALIGYLIGSLILVFTSQYLMFLLKVAVPIVEPVSFGVFCGLLFRIMLSNPLSASIRRK